MTLVDLRPLKRLLRLVAGMLSVPPGRGRIALAYLYGLVCHTLFAAAVLAMIAAMFFGMSRSLGASGSMAVSRQCVPFAPVPADPFRAPVGARAQVAIGARPVRTRQDTGDHNLCHHRLLQLLLLFAFWTPSGVIWWQAEGAVFWLLCGLYTLSWLLLIKASYDAGAEVQSGALGWMSLAQNIRPIFPDMPETGLFKIIRQPIYVSFALTTWTVPVWTPDQLAVASFLTAYCLLAPMLKERRFASQFGDRFRQYQAAVPYIFPNVTRRSKK
jgi:protein-S-isoprenylcysteine O-methyltransferase Ste14